MTQNIYDSTFTLIGVTNKLEYIDHHFFAFEAREQNSVTVLTVMEIPTGTSSMATITISTGFRVSKDPANAI